MSARDTQCGGEHYRVLPVQPWDLWDTGLLDPLEAAIAKYLMRRKGDRVVDLRKALHCAEHRAERVEAAREIVESATWLTGDERDALTGLLYGRDIRAPILCAIEAVERGGTL